MATSKEGRDLVRKAVKAGCKALRLKNGHTRVTAPNGVFRDFSFSPGTNRCVREQQIAMRKFLSVNLP